MSNFFKVTLLLFISSLFLTCCTCSSDADQRRVRRPSRDAFIKHNRNLFWSDSLCIVRYSDSLNLNPHPTETNLWLTVHDEGSTTPLEIGDKVSFNYVVSNLLGDTIYTSAKDGIRTITLGRNEDTMGIDEALLLLHRKASATVILIPEKAYGLRGDDKKIHGRTILRYDIQIIE